MSDSTPPNLAGNVADGPCRESSYGGPSLNGKRSYAFLKRYTAVCAALLASLIPCQAQASAESVKQLTFNPAIDWMPNWSPDGTHIVFVSARERSSNVWRMLAQGENVEPAIRLTDHPSSNWDPCLSPDGQNMAFVSNRDDADREIYRMALSADTAIRITHSFGYDLEPAWSPDGQSILFVSNRNETWDLWLMGAMGEEPRCITPGDYDEYLPCWSPDGLTVAFMSYRSGNADIWVMPVDGTEEDAKQITAQPGVDNCPNWSPDGRLIAFSSERSGNREIWLADARGEAFGLAQVTCNPADDRQPKWSPDGTMIAFASNRTGNWEIWVADDLPTSVAETTWGRTKSRFRQNSIKPRADEAGTGQTKQTEN